MNNTVQQQTNSSQGVQGFSALWRQIDPYLFILFVIFTAVSLYSVSTTSGQETYQYFFEGKGSFSPLTKHFIIITVSWIGALFFPLLGGKRLQVWGFMTYTLFSLLLLALMLTSGEKINEAERWIKLFGISIQPSEFWKLELIFFVALFCSRYIQHGSPKSHADYWRYFGIPILLSTAFIGYIGYSNVSTGLIYMCLMGFMYFVCKMPFSWYFKTFGTLAAAAIALFLFSLAFPNLAVGRMGTVAARTSRILETAQQDTIANKDSLKLVVTDKNRQEMYGRIALANSNMLGRGIGQSKIKDLMPMANSDYVYAILIEETGPIALIGIPLLYIWWFFLAGSMARKETDLFCRFVLYGIGVLYPFQAVINFIVVSGVFTTGQTLPFLSAGGSSFLASSISLSVMVAISQWQKARGLGLPSPQNKTTKPEAA